MAELKGLLQAPPLLGRSAKAASLKMRGRHLVRKTSSCSQGSQTTQGIVPTGLSHRAGLCGWEPLERMSVTAQPLAFVPDRRRVEPEAKPAVVTTRETWSAQERTDRQSDLKRGDKALEETHFKENKYVKER